MIIPIVGPTIEKIEEQMRLAQPMAAILEWRIDLFAPSAIKNLGTLRQKVTKPLLFTLRKKSQGGHFEGSEEERLEAIKSLLSLKPTYFDLEYDTFLDLGNVKRITSYHNFIQTPKDLEALLRQMKKIPSYLYKIATMAHSTNDALAMLKLCHNDQTVLGLCMGEKGIITRILAKPYTFVCLNEEQKTAPGQITAEEFKIIYEKRGKKLFGLIGTAVQQSLSHLTHNKLMQENELDSVYLKMVVEEGELEEFFSLAKEVGFCGLSVTIALKELVGPFLDEIDEEAKKIGAINTIVFKEGKLIGYNTDGKGALDAIEKKVLVKNKKVVILGAGGSARAIIFEALKRGAEVIVINRTFERAKSLAKEFNIKVSRFETDYDILINTTPNPMPISENMIRAQSFVMDIQTKPKKTTLLERAEEKGCALIFGYEMFMNQALRQFQLWFENRHIKTESFEEELLFSLEGK